MPAWYQTFRAPLLLLQSLAGVLLFAYPLRRRPGYWGWLVGGCLVGCLLIQGFGQLPPFTQVGTLGSLVRLLTVLLVYLVLIAIVYAVHQESVWTALFVASSGYIAQDIGGSVKTLVKLAPPAAQCAQHPVGILLLDLLCYGGTYLLLFFLFRPYTRRRDENFDNKLKAVFSFVVLLLCIGMARLTQDNAARNTMALVSESVYQCISDALLLILQFGVMEHARLTHHVDAMRELIHQQHSQYTASKENMQLVNEKYHDLKRLLQGFHGRVPPHQLEKLEHSIDAYEAQVHTGNDVLDVLLTEKRTLCTQQNIQLTCFAGGADLAFVEELDLYTLLGNALNNAIEAVEALPPGRARFISLTARREGNMLALHMENPCAGTIPFADGLPQSVRDPRYHGFGMKSMQRTAAKYGGSLAATQRGDMFYLDILLFAPETGQNP